MCVFFSPTLDVCALSFILPEIKVLFTDLQNGNFAKETLQQQQNNNNICQTFILKISSNKMGSMIFEILSHVESHTHTHSPTNDDHSMRAR